MEIEVGEYIRDREGNIDKITDIHPLFKDIYLYSGTNDYQYSDNAIVNHSKDIIDLIQVGDFVNGVEVEEISREYINDMPKKCLYMRSDLETGWENTIFNEDIKSILTHEQYKKIAYRLEE